MSQAIPAELVTTHAVFSFFIASSRSRRNTIGIEEVHEGAEVLIVLYNVGQLYNNKTEGNHASRNARSSDFGRRRVTNQFKRLPRL